MHPRKLPVDMQRRIAIFEPKTVISGPKNLLDVYKQSDFSRRKRLIPTLTPEQRNLLWTKYLDDLDQVIKQYEKQKHAAGIAAREIYKNLEYYRGCSGMYSDQQLFSVLHKTTAMLRTPVNSPKFKMCSAAFLQEIEKLRIDGRKCVWIGAGTALVSLLLLGGVAAISYALIPAFASSIFGVIAKGLFTALDVGAGAISLVSAGLGIFSFVNAYRNFTLANEIDSMRKVRGPDITSESSADSVYTNSR